jgi:hypothetical protein
MGADVGRVGALLLLLTLPRAAPWAKVAGAAPSSAISTRHLSLSAGEALLSSQSARLRSTSAFLSTPAALPAASRLGILPLLARLIKLPRTCLQPKDFEWIQMACI